MFGIDDAVIAGGAGLIGSLFTNQTNKDIADSHNTWSAAQYANRYQTMTKDMEAAGLNPMLAYSQSAGAAPTAQAVQMQNPVSSAVDAYSQAQQVSQSKAQIGNIQADTQLKAAQAEAAEAQARSATAEANAKTLDLVTGNDLKRAQTAGVYSQITMNKANLPKIAQEIVTGGAQAGFYRASARKAMADGAISEQDFFRAMREAEANKSAYGAARPYIKDAIGAVGGIKGAFRSAPTINKSYTIYKR